MKIMRQQFEGPDLTATALATSYNVQPGN